ncbi:HAMP domain-containing sensor histidine kinase [Pseudofrankia sp. BMG5.37]|uniref:sensor histidine kinase n=1 Tax=Pseudofrankia sp. BMG5.37 TaxID=3050035 RepID=UPI00289534AE|nr:HAMP domain-containing sensor histidine kinase [Pseudofrankia sp. BMG5.37]MDT3440623.1 HAMP domain-containing sensor histidine kinase [Pseudofrankia sp. BMG5.37]
MRTRLLTILLAFMTATLAALGVPLGRSVAQSQQQQMFVDRLADTSRFAGIAGQAPAGDGDQELRDELTHYEQLYGIAAVVVDLNEDVRAASSPGVDARVEELRPALQGALRGRRSSDPGQIWPWQDRPLVVAEPVVSGRDVVGAAVTISPTGRLSGRILRWWLWLLAAAVVVTCLWVGAAVRLTRWVLRPVHDLGLVTHEIATGRLSARVLGSAGPLELRRLTLSFNEMAGHVEDAVEAQRAFVADASHQLRNPLSALLLRIENLAMDLPDQWQEEVGETRVEARRLVRVLDEMLALARAEHHVARPEKIDVRAVVDERVAAWRPMGDARGVSVDVTGLTSVSAVTDVDALEGALDAVLDNALKFSPLDSTVTVTVSLGPDGPDGPDGPGGPGAAGDAPGPDAARDGGGQTARDATLLAAHLPTVAATRPVARHLGEPAGDVFIRVSDQGPGVTVDELASIGRRFWRSRRNVNIGGSGLGLSIATTLLAASGGDIRYALGEPAGLVVTLRLPPASPSSPGAAT